MKMDLYTEMKFEKSFDCCALKSNLKYSQETFAPYTIFTNNNTRKYLFYS